MRLNTPLQKRNPAKHIVHYQCQANMMECDQCRAYDSQVTLLISMNEPNLVGGDFNLIAHFERLLSKLLRNLAWLEMPSFTRSSATRSTDCHRCGKDKILYQNLFFRFFVSLFAFFIWVRLNSTPICAGRSGPLIYK